MCVCVCVCVCTVFDHTSANTVKIFGLDMTYNFTLYFGSKGELCAGSYLIGWLLCFYLRARMSERERGGGGGEDR